MSVGGTGTVDVRRHDQEYQEIIDHLNARTDRRFGVDAVTTKRLLADLFARGHTVDQIKQVIDHKAEEWNGIAAMRPYLRPSTLFELCNFRTYLVECDLIIPKSLQL